MPPSQRRIKIAILTAVLAVIAGLIGVGVLALVPLGILLLSEAVGEDAVWQVASGLLVVLSCIALGAVCGAAFDGTARPTRPAGDRFYFMLFAGAACVGAMAGALAFATRGLGVMTLAGLMGLAGAGIAARASSEMTRWLDAHVSKLPPGLKRLLS